MMQLEELKEPPVRSYLASLNEAQREAVEFGVDRHASESLPGPLLVIVFGILTLALHDERAHADIRSEGDAVMLTEIFFLFRNLRWDAAEDLSRITGDVAAERIARAAHDGKQHLQDAALNLSQAAAEYLTEEHPLLVKPAQVASFVQQVDTLRDDIARLEQRVHRLKSSGNS